MKVRLLHDKLKIPRKKVKLSEVSMQTSILKLSISLIGIVMLFISHQLQANDAPLLKEDIKLTEALHRLSQKYEVFFSYDETSISSVEVTYQPEKYKNVEHALDELLKGTVLKYKVFDNRYIILYEESKEALTSLKGMVRHLESVIDSQEKAVQVRETIKPVAILKNSFVKQMELLYSVSGRVTDQQGEPLIGVNIQVKGTNKGATTDIEGHFTLEDIDENAILVISYIGYQTQEVSVTGKSVLNIILNSDSQLLDEVVVVGYGTMRKSDLTGSVSSVKSEELSAFPTTSVMQSLQGRVPGLHIQQNSGAPGGNIQVRLRGTNSIQGGNEPLWIIDGFPGNINLINSTDIESIEVLKDASATAIYGSRGANGVIIITTKQGREGPTMVNYTGSYSIQSISKKLNMMNAMEYAELYNIYTKKEQGTAYFSDQEIQNFGRGTNWQDIVFRNAPVHNHSLNISGGNANTKYSLGLSLLDQEGIIQSNDYRRITMRGNLNHKINNMLSVSYGIILNRNDRTLIDENSIVRWTITASPTSGPYSEDGSYTMLNTLYPFSPDDLGNPVANLNEISRKNFSNNVMSNLALNIKPIEDLNIKISGNVISTDSRSDTYTSVNMPERNSGASISQNNTLHFNIDNIATYTKNLFSNHRINATGAITYEGRIDQNLGASGTGFLSDVTETYNLGSATNFGVPSTSYNDWTLLSYLGRINYTVHEKYLFTAAIRADGSSRYSDKNKWGVFPSGAFAWRFSEEAFLKQQNFITDGKIRVSYGKTGSTAIDPYFTLDMLNSGKVALGNELHTFFAPGTRLPSELKWETTSQFDVGIDFGILNNRYRFSADYYIKTTRDLLNNVPLPLSLGYVTTVQNIGTMQNKGFEFQIDTDIYDKDIKWNLSANIAFNRNKIISLYEGQDIKGSIYSVTVDNSYLNLLQEGKPLGAFVGYLYDGFDENGHFTYKDLNNDGILDDNDRTWIGDPNPNFTFGINSNASFRGVNLSIFLLGSQGNDIFGLSYLHHNFVYYQGFNTLKDVLYDHWTEENTSAKYPSIDYSLSPKYSDQFVFDGSFIRIKNVEVGYNIPIRSNRFESLYIYVSGQNLLTFTNYNWWDPEVNSKGGSNSVNQGIDHYSYPSSKGYTFGIKFNY